MSSTQSTKYAAPTTTPAIRRLRGGERDGQLCTCGTALGARAHVPGYLLRHGNGTLDVACVNAAAAFAHLHQLAFPLTSAAAPSPA